MLPAKKAAVLDLGTNTFHLIIAQKSEKGLNILRRDKHFVHLGEGDLGHLSDAAVERALSTLNTFQTILRHYPPISFRILATAALRCADNARAFIAQVEKELGWKIEVISGEEEAELIHLGIIHLAPDVPTQSLMMDIGGGSVEFIHSKDRQIRWKHSFDIGVAALSEYQTPDPLPSGTYNALRDVIHEALAPLWAYLKTLKTPLPLVGASGSFDTLQALIPSDRGSLFSCQQFKHLHHQLLSSTLVERLNMEGMPPHRAQYMVTASVLIDRVLEALNSPYIYVSSVALKEGALWDLLDKP